MSMKRILCYGDSNTYGADPRTVASEGREYRCDEQTRWTCLLEKALGPEYKVYEAGMSGRTTVFEDPVCYGRNGLAALDTVFLSCDPVDLVVVMLGTNDLKDLYGVSAYVICRGMERLLRRLKALIAESLGPEAKILILAPANVTAAQDGTFYYDFSERSVEKGARLAELYADLAQRLDCYFADAGQWVTPHGADGVHYGPEGHRAFAEGLEPVVRGIFAEN